MILFLGGMAYTADPVKIWMQIYDNTPKSKLYIKIEIYIWSRGILQAENLHIHSVTNQVWKSTDIHLFI